MAAREIVTDGWRVRLDTAGQVLAVEVPEFDGRYRADDEERVIPVLPPPGDGPVSAATLILKAKQFDDGLMAAAELAAQRGIDRFAGKANFLSALAGALGRRPAAVPVLAACQLGNVAATVPPDLEAAVADASARFTADALRSRPLGFYTWTPELEAVFRQDRFLQQPLDNCVADDATAALDRVSDGRRTYDALLSLATRLTNPPGRAVVEGHRGQALVSPGVPVARGAVGRTAVRRPPDPGRIRPDGRVDPPRPGGRDRPDPSGRRRVVRLADMGTGTIGSPGPRPRERRGWPSGRATASTSKTCSAARWP